MTVDIDGNGKGRSSLGLFVLIGRGFVIIGVTGVLVPGRVLQVIGSRVGHVGQGVQQTGIVGPGVFALTTHGFGILLLATLQRPAAIAIALVFLGGFLFGNCRVQLFRSERAGGRDSGRGVACKHVRRTKIDGAAIGDTRHSAEQQGCIRLRKRHDPGPCQDQRSAVGRDCRKLHIMGRLGLDGQARATGQHADGLVMIGIDLDPV